MYIYVVCILLLYFLLDHKTSLTFTHEITKMPGERQGILNVSFRFVSTLLQVVFSTLKYIQ